MNYRIRFSDGTEFLQPERPATVVSSLHTAGRDWTRICVIGDVDTIKSAFVNGAKYAQVWDSVVVTVGENDEEIENVQEVERDLSYYCVAGEIVDHRDGTCTVLMGRPTALELIQAQMAEKTEALAILMGEPTT